MSAPAITPASGSPAVRRSRSSTPTIRSRTIRLRRRFRELFVISRNSAFVYKGKPINAQSVANELGVQYVVEGSVRRAGSRVRITAQLIDAETDRHLWAERYDRELADIFAIQDEVTFRLGQSSIFPIKGRQMFKPH